MRCLSNTRNSLSYQGWGTIEVHFYSTICWLDEAEVVKDPMILYKQKALCLDLFVKFDFSGQGAKEYKYGFRKLEMALK